MKRALIATILGLAASVASSYGQATYYFDTYLTYGPASNPIMWGAIAPSGLAGTVASNNQSLVADLLWQVGTASGTANLLPVQVDQYGFIENGFSANNGPGETQVIFDPTYVGGTPINFTIQVWQGANFAGATYKGSETWTDPGSAVGAGFNAFGAPAFPAGSIIVNGVIPEPTTLALAGLGAAGLLMFRKRQ